jgi:ribosomal protein L31
LLYLFTEREIYPNGSKIRQLFDGKRLCLISSTKPELQVDMWLANHPFYNKSQIMVDEAKVELRNL